MKSLRQIWQAIDAHRAHDSRFSVCAIAPIDGDLDVLSLLVNWLECHSDKRIYRITSLHNLAKPQVSLDLTQTPPVIGPYERTSHA